jgi:hypothetical protein
VGLFRPTVLDISLFMTPFLVLLADLPGKSSCTENLPGGATPSKAHTSGAERDVESVQARVSRARKKVKSLVPLSFTVLCPCLLHPCTPYSLQSSAYAGQKQCHTHILDCEATPPRLLYFYSNTITFYSKSGVIDAFLDPLPIQNVPP